MMFSSAVHARNEHKAVMAVYSRRIEYMPPMRRLDGAGVQPYFETPEGQYCADRAILQPRIDSGENFIPALSSPGRPILDLTGGTHVFDRVFMNKWVKPVHELSRREIIEICASDVERFFSVHPNFNVISRTSELRTITYPTHPIMATRPPMLKNGLNFSEIKTAVQWVSLFESACDAAPRDHFVTREFGYYADLPSGYEPLLISINAYPLASCHADTLRSLLSTDDQPWRDMFAATAREMPDIVSEGKLFAYFLTKNDLV